MKQQQTKDSKQALRNLLGLLKPYRMQLVVILFCAILSTIFTIVGPKILGEATTVLFEGLVSKVSGGQGVDFTKIGSILSVLLVIYIISSLFNALQGFMMSNVTRNVTYSLRQRMQAKIDNLPISYFDNTTTGDVLSLVTNDIDAIDSNLSNTVTQLVTSVTLILGILYMMFTINWQMTLAALVILPLSMMLLMLVFSKSQRFFVDQQARLGDVNGHIEEMFTNHLIIKAFNGEGASLEAFDTVNDDLFDVGVKASFVSGLIHPIMNFVGNVGYVCVSILGGYFASQGVISVGDIQSFIQYMRTFMNPIAQIGQLASTFQQSLAASERVFDFLNATEEIDHPTRSGIDLEAIEGRVGFDAVNFGYLPEQLIIKNLQASFEQGQKIAIVGSTGSGKTTLVKLLMRFYDVTSGAILIDDINIKEFSRSDLRQLMGMVLQDTWLYSGTIKENIRYGNLNATDEMVIQAAKDAQADYFIRTLEAGYDTMLDEETSNISAGQKQLLTIARAILADPEILILDEATSSVDTRTEVLIQKALDHLMDGRTSFIIAHRLSTIRNADVIMVMEHGVIVEMGNHDALIQKDGAYASLYNSQFEEE